EAAIVNGATRGLWADLPAGTLTFGHLFDLFPFDNRIAQMTLTGAELRGWLTGEIVQGRHGGLGISGLNARIGCTAAGLHVDRRRDDGRMIREEGRVRVVAIAQPTLSGSVATAASTGVESADQALVVREVVEDWFRRTDGLPRLQRDAVTPRLEFADGQA